ncbi:MAG: patatin-like phospholipase family protein [Acidobacteriota bacterium]
MRRFGWLALLVFSLEILPGAEAQPQVPRKRVGIALAGGGAKGLAHIGVLRWMEENRVPIDAIAGTSMGGLVGGMYAGGSSSREIQEFVGEIEWDEVLGAGPGYRDLTYRRKEDQQSFPATIELGLRDHKIQLPAGMNAGHQVGLLLGRIGLPYSQVNFDELPTPFRCVAADLVSGDEVVFEKGSLSQALRATMAIPPFFAPVQHEGMLLVDGGLLDNLPAGVVRGMKVDVVIAVDLGMEKIEAGKGLAILDVANRSLDIMIRRNAVESLKKADVALTPQVTEYGMLHFHHPEEIIQRGYEAAQAMAAELKQYAVSEQEWQVYLETRRSKAREAGFTPQFVDLTGTLPHDRQALEERVAEFSGKKLDRERLEDRLMRIAGLGPYGSADYRKTERGDEAGLSIEVTRKSHGPPFVRPLLLLDSGQAGASSFTLGARITAYDAPTRNSEWRTDFSIGRIQSIGTEYYQFAGSRGLFIAPRGFATQEQQLFVNDGVRVAEYSLHREGGGLDVGYNFGRFSEVRTGVELAHIRGDVQIGSPVLPRARGGEQIWMTRWKYNALNSGTIPTEGFSISTQLNWQFASPGLQYSDGVQDGGSFGQTWAQMVYARKFSQKWSGIARVLGGGTFAGEVQPFSEFRLGGPLRLGALEVGERRGGNVAYGSAGVLRRLSQAPVVGKLYGVVQYETGDAFNSKLSLYHGGTAGVMAETALGVMFAGFSYGERGRGGFFFSLGRIFDSGIQHANPLR